jgi:hypothetical protein
MGQQNGSCNECKLTNLLRLLEIYLGVDAGRLGGLILGRTGGMKKRKPCGIWLVKLIRP